MSNKSLTEAAKAVLEGKTLEEGYGINYPSVGNGSVSNPNPVDPSTASTGNAKTLHPGTKYKEDKKRSQNGAGSTDNSDVEGKEHDLGGQTPTSLPSGNLGAAAAADVGKDASRAGKPSVAAEKIKKLKSQPQSVQEDEEVDGEVMEEEIELSDELEAFVNEAIEAGLDEEEILAAIEENFEFVSEEDEVLDESTEEEQIDEISDALKARYYKKAEKGSSVKVDNKTVGKVYYDPSKSKKFGRWSGNASRSDGFEGADSRHDAKRAVRADAGHDSRFTKEEVDYSAVADYQIDMSEHVDALLAGENLSEEFHAKATTIFEAAVKAKLEEEVALLEQAYAETLEERVAEIAEQLSSDVDNYLNYVVEQWIEENEVAVESALRSELTEEFISGLKSLFAEHYIDIPEESVNVVEELSSTVEELEEKLNEEIERNVQLTSALNESVKNEIVSLVSEGLTTNQAEKLKNLAENIAYTSDEEFAEKISTLRENYFPTTVKTDEVLDRVESQDPKMIAESTLEGPMANYVKALGRSLPN